MEEVMTTLTAQEIVDLCVTFGFDVGKDDKGQIVIYTKVFVPPEKKGDEALDKTGQKGYNKERDEVQ